MQRLLIDQSTFRRILGRFAANNATMMDQIRTAYANRQWELMQRLAHTIKGAAANISAEELQQAAWELEKPIKEGREQQPLNDQLDQLEIKINQVIKSLALLQEPEEKTGDIDSATDDSTDLLTSLQEFLHTLDESNPAKITKQMAVLKGRIPGDIAEQIETLITDYDYDEASRIVQKVLNG